MDRNRWRQISGLLLGAVLLTLLPSPQHRAEAAGTSVLISDVYVDKGRFSPGASVPVVVELSNQTGGPWTGPIAMRVAHLDETITTQSQSVSLAAGQDHTLTFTWTAPTIDYRGYMVEIDAGATDSAVTAVDVSSSWTRFPRYGWLAEYPVGETAAQSADKVRQLVRDYHLNGLQFYDWMWRHENVIQRADGVPTDTWDDWSGITISRQSVENAITAARSMDVASMPYAMAYAGLQGYEQISGVSPTWGIFSDTNHQSQLVFDFGDQDPSTNLWLFNPANPDWQSHIIDEYRDQVNTIGFDGVHIDQLGQRDNVFDYGGNPVELERTFSTLANASKAALTANDPARDIVTFNIVNGAAGGWAAEDVSSNANVDFLYSEIWENSETYQSVKSFVEQARGNADYKAMVLAAYMNYYENAGPRLEAEDAARNGVAVDTNHSGYTGTGFVDEYGEDGDWLEFAINVVEQREYALVFRYGNGGAQDATRTVFVDGVDQGQVTFPRNSTWGEWEYDAYMVVELEPGSHTVRLARTSADAEFINLDSLTLGTFSEPAVRLANAAFSVAGASHIEMGEGDQMLAHPYFPNRYKQMSRSLNDAMGVHYDFITAYENLLFDPDVRPTDSGTQFVTVSGEVTSGDASANTIWNTVKRGPEHDVIHMVNLAGNDDQWRNTASTPATKTNLAVKYYLGPNATPEGVYLASPDIDQGRSQELAFASGTDSIGSYVSFTVPSLNYWNMIYVRRGFTPPADDRYEAEDATKTNVTTGTTHTGYTGTGYVDNFVTTNSGVSFVVQAGTADDYTLRFRYGNGGGDASRSVFVDGEYRGRIGFSSLGTWNAWATEQLTTRLSPGLHTVVLWQTPSDAGAINVDHLRPAETYIWSRAVPTTGAPPGYHITFRLEDDGWVHWGTDGWQNVTDARLRSNGSSNTAERYETVIGPFTAGTAVDFTFAFDTNGNGLLDAQDTWEGRDYRITVN